MIFDALVAGHMRQHAMRSVITVLTVAVGTAVAFAIALLNGVTVDSLASDSAKTAENVNLQLFGSSLGIDERLLYRSKLLPGVIDADPRTEDSLLIQNTSGSSTSIQIVGIDALEPLPLEAEIRRYLPGPYDPYGSAPWMRALVYEPGIILSSAVAQQLNLQVGQSFDGTSGSDQLRFTVAGVMPSTYTGFDSTVAFVDIATAQRYFGKVGRLDRIDLVVDPSRLNLVAMQLTKMLPRDIHVVAPFDRPRDNHFIVGAFRTDLAILAIVALVVSTCLVYNALAISVIQRSDEIGTLRALGTRRLQIVYAFLLEGLTYGALGCFSGLMLGALLAQNIAEQFDGLHQGQLVYSVTDLLIAFAIGLVLTTSAAVIPAIRAAAVRPALSMRSSLSDHGNNEAVLPPILAAAFLVALACGCWYLSRQYASQGLQLVTVLALILGVAIGTNPITRGLARLLRYLSQYAPLTIKIAAQTLSWSPTRLSIAVAALTIAITLSAGVSITTASLRGAVERWAAQAYSADLYVRPLENADPTTNRLPPSVLSTIAGIAGVSSIVGDRHKRVDVDGRYVTIIGRFDGSNTRRPGANIGPVRALGSQALFRDLRLSIGRRLDISGPSDVSVVVDGTYQDLSSDQDSLRISHQAYMRIFGDADYDSIAVYARSSTTSKLGSEIAQRLLPLKVSVEDSHSLRRQAVEVFDKTFIIETIFGAIVIGCAAFGVVTSLFALILERQAELRILRRVGAARSVIGGAVVTECILIAILACILGVVSGVALGATLAFGLDGQLSGGTHYLIVPLTEVAALVCLVIGISTLAGCYLGHITVRLPSLDEARIAPST